MFVRINCLSKTYPARDGAVAVLRGVDLQVERGASLALTGESGSGKSTLLHLMAGLDRPDSGTVSIDGTALEELDDAGLAALRRSRVGLVFQQFNLIPALDVAANLSFQARLAGRNDPARIRDLVTRLGLSGLENRYPEELSGGQQQRVAIGRALAVRPDLVLADEPTGNLDEATGDAVLDLLLEAVAAEGATLIMVTHSPRLASRLERMARLVQGRIE